MQSVPFGPEPSNEDYFGESLLIEDYPIQVLPKLAVAIGLNESIVVQQLFWLFKCKSNGRIINAHRWIFNTYEEWRTQYFPFWSIPTLKRIFAQLERMHIVASCQPEHSMSRRKYYRLSDGMVNLLRKGKVMIPKGTRIKSLPSDQNDTMNVSGCAVPVTETSGRDNLTKESKETSSADDDSGKKMASPAETEHEAVWKPDNRSKAQKLASIRPPVDYPSEREFDDFLEDNDSVLLDHRPDLYDVLTNRKWRHWNEDHQKWTRIRDWKAYVLALDEKIVQRW